jgi:hypothetical protein
MNIVVPSSIESRSERARAASVTEALNKAVAGGLSGGAAQGINVVALMWLRTTMNVQMVNGSSMRDAFKALYAQVRQLTLYPAKFKAKLPVTPPPPPPPPLKCAFRVVFHVSIAD